MRRTDFSSYPQLKPVGNNTYKATGHVCFDINNITDAIYENDLIRVERPTAKEILDVKNLIDRQLKDKKHNNILYHLDNKQFSHYRNHELTEIYRRN